MNVPAGIAIALELDVQVPERSEQFHMSLGGALGCVRRVEVNCLFQQFGGEGPDGAAMGGGLAGELGPRFWPDVECDRHGRVLPLEASVPP
ncbi:MAG TPA: hypothetical protein VIY49_29430 [Bryobacteraceae bacterium]